MLISFTSTKVPAFLFHVTSTGPVQDLAVTRLNYYGLFYLVPWFVKIKTRHLPLHGFQTSRISLWSIHSRTARAASLFSLDLITSTSSTEESFMLTLYSVGSPSFTVHRGTSPCPICSVSWPSPVNRILLQQVISKPKSFSHSSFITKPSLKVCPEFVRMSSTHPVFSLPSLSNAWL